MIGSDSGQEKDHDSDSIGSPILLYFSELKNQIEKVQGEGHGKEKKRIDERGKDTSLKGKRNTFLLYLQIHKIYVYSTSWM